MASTVTVDPDQVKLIRKGLFERIKEDDYDEKDIERYKNEDAQIARHIKGSSKKKGQELIDETVATLQEVLEWRTEMGVANLFDCDFSPQVIKVWDQIISEGGREKKSGAKIYWAQLKNWSDDYYDKMPDCKRYQAHLWEKFDVENWNDKGFTYWCDYGKISLSGMSGVEVMKYSSKMMGYYLGGLQYLGVYDMPMLIRKTWSVLSALTPPDIAKIAIPISKEELDKYIAPSELPEKAK